MKKYTLILLVFISLSAKSQVVNRFRDSTWFAKSVRFDSAIYLIKGASNGKVLTSDAYGRATWQSASGGVSQSALDDSINSVRSIRKVDTLYKNLDSIIYKINGIRYSIKDSVNDLSSYALQSSLNDSTSALRLIRKVDSSYIFKNASNDSICQIAIINGVSYRSCAKDSTGVGADSQSLHLAFSDSIQLSITRGNSIKFAYAIDSVSFITDSLIVFKGGVRKSYVKNTVSFVKNTSKDSIILTLNGNRYAVKDSIGSGGGSSSFSGLTSATGTNTIDNANYGSEWQWNSLTSGSALKLTSNSTSATTGNTLLELTNSGSTGASVNTFGLKVTNTKVSSAGVGIGGYFSCNTSGGYALDIDGDSRITAGKSLYYGNASRIYNYGAVNLTVEAPTSGGLFLISKNTGGVTFASSTTVVFSSLTNISSTNQSLVFGGDYSGGFRAVGTSTSTIKRETGKLILCANTGLSGGYAGFTPNEVLTINGNSTASTSNVGIGTNAPDASAKLEISSTVSGFLPPRMTATQASAISSPAKSLMVYVTDTNGTFTSAGLWIYTTLWKLIIAE